MVEISHDVHFELMLIFRIFLRLFFEFHQVKHFSPLHDLAGRNVKLDVDLLIVHHIVFLSVFHRDQLIFFALHHQLIVDLSFLKAQLFDLPFQFLLYFSDVFVLSKICSGHLLIPVRLAS